MQYIHQIVNSVVRDIHLSHILFRSFHGSREVVKFRSIKIPDDVKKKHFCKLAKSFTSESHRKSNKFIIFFGAVGIVLPATVFLFFFYLW